MDVQDSTRYECTTWDKNVVPSLKHKIFLKIDMLKDKPFLFNQYSNWKGWFWSKPSLSESTHLQRFPMTLPLAIHQYFFVRCIVNGFCMLSNPSALLILYRHAQTMLVRTMTTNSVKNESSRTSRTTLCTILFSIVIQIIKLNPTSSWLLKKIVWDPCPTTCSFCLHTIQFAGILFPVSLFSSFLQVVFGMVWCPSINEVPEVHYLYLIINLPSQ